MRRREGKRRGDERRGEDRKEKKQKVDVKIDRGEKRAEEKE